MPYKVPKKHQKSLRQGLPKGSSLWAVNLLPDKTTPQAPGQHTVAGRQVVRPSCGAEPD